jgi:hypothetical protein
METIVERVLKVRARASGEETAVKVLIGRPNWTIKDVEAACPLTIETLYGELAPIRGIDPLDALRNAIRMVDRLLTGVRDKYEIYWSDGDEYDPIE